MSAIFVERHIATRHQHIAHSRRRVVIKSSSESFIVWWKNQSSEFRVAVIKQDFGDSIEVDLHLVSRGAWAGDWKTLERRFEITASDDHSDYNLRNCERHTVCCAGDKTGDCPREIDDETVEQIKKNAIESLWSDLKNMGYREVR